MDESQLRCAKEARHTKLHIQYISIYMKFWNQLIYYERNQIRGGLGGRYGRDWFHRGRKVLSRVMEMFCLKWEGNSIDVYICQNHWTLHLKCILYGNYTSNTDSTTYPPEILKFKSNNTNSWWEFGTIVTLTHCLWGLVVKTTLEV